MGKNIDNLNFKVILDDKDFDTRVKADIQLAKDLNIELSKLLQAKVNLNTITAQEAASAKRASDIITKQATDQEKIRQAKAKTAEAEEKVATQTAKTTKELERANAATSQTAVNTQRLATETQRTAAATNQAAVNSQRLVTETQRTATETQRTATATANAANAMARAQLQQKRLADYSKRVTKEYQAQSRLANELKGYILGYMSIRGASQLISSLVRVTGEFELQKTTLSAMLGDLNQAESIMTNIKALAVESPFTFGELSTYTKQLSAFSVPAKELYETTKMLADISAGLGVGMDRIVLAYGQVRSAAFLRGQEVRQFTEAGIPILAELAKQFEELEGRAVSAGEVFDRISARLVPFEMVSKVLQDMTSEGGKFYEMQSIQSETLKGRVMKLKDAFQIMLAEIGDANSDKMKGALDSVMTLMKNWEKVGAILKTLIVTFGVYKATLATVWAYEKLMAGVESIKRWQRMNQLMIATTGNTNRLATAMRNFGIASKAAAGVALGAISALVTIIVTAIKNANKLKKELESIVSSELSGSNKMTDELSVLVDRLKGATQGTQEYRNIISELNNKYGDYLPKVYSEADAYDAVKVAADAAAEAIKNKARAQAFEKGTQAIEEEYGKGLTELAKGIENTLMFIDPAIPKKAAVEFVKFFKKSILTYDYGGDYKGAFEGVYKEFFGKDNLTTLLEAANGKMEGYSDRASSLIQMYGEMVERISQEQQNLDSDLETRFGVSEYSSYQEMKRLHEIDVWYKQQEQDLLELKVTQDEYNEALEKLEINKLRKLIDAYTKLKRLNVAQDYQNQLDAMTKIPEGWRGTVQSVLKDLGLKKGTSFGLWADETTQSTSYVEEMVKRYKELKDEIKWVSTFDEDQTERLKKNKEAIEAVAKALKIDLDKLALGKNEKSPEQKRIETQIDLVKKLQDAYEKLMPFLTGEQMGKTLSQLFPEAKAEWLKTFDFKSVLDQLADDLYKYDQEASKKLKSSVAKDVAGSMADAFKEIEAYKQMLDEWMGEDFNLGGKGVTLDINKIIRDLNSQYNQIDQKRLKAMEMLKKAEEGDAVAMAEVRKILGEEVWKKYLTDGEKAIEELTNKEKQSAREIADEKIRDKATSYMQELLDAKNIDLTDLGDKSTNQLRTLIERMKELQNELSKGMGDLAAQMLNNEFDKGQKAQWDMLSKVIEMLGLKIEDVSIALDKSIFEKMKDGIGVVSSLSDEITKLGEAMGSDPIERFGKNMSDISLTITKLIPLAQDLGETLKADGVEFTKIMGKTKSGKQYVKSIESNKTFDELSDSAKGGIVAILAAVVTTVISEITKIVTHATTYQAKLNDAMWEYNDALSETRRSAHSGIFGTDEIALAAENTEILAEAQEKYNDILNKVGEVRFQKYGDTWKKQSLADILGDIGDVQGWDLYLENGQVNIKALENYYDLYSDRLTRKQRNLVKELIESGNAVDDASAQQAKYLTDLYSGVADTIAENMVNAFIESGDAAIDMGELVSNTAKTMVADLIKTLYLMPILNSYQKQAEEIQKNTSFTPDQRVEAQLNLLDTALGNIAEREDDINATLERFADYLGAGEEGTKDLGEGIKGITQDQANLLASYLNAIRADVAYSKTLWQSMDSNLQRIADMLVSSPSLMEYQAQIAANTYNTAQTTQAILARLNDVIAIGDYGEGIKIIS